MKDTDRLQAILDLLETKSNADDLTQAVQVALTLFSELKQANDEQRTELSTAFSAAMSKIEAKVASLKDGNDYVLTPADKTEIAQKINVPVVEKEIIIKELPVVTEITNEIPNKDTAEDIRNKLELLTGEERLDASAIKNLPELVATHTPAVIGGHGPLWALLDVDIAGIVTGQSIKWDGIRWIPFTPAGANTSVFGESPTDTGDHTSFTLAHTPAAGTLRVYRGGAYQQAGVSNDYTLSSATMTLSSALQNGEVLLCDYEY